MVLVWIPLAGPLPKLRQIVGARVVSRRIFSTVHAVELHLAELLVDSARVPYRPESRFVGVVSATRIVYVSVTLLDGPCFEIGERVERIQWALAAR